MKRCDLSLGEHVEPCSNAAHIKALAIIASRPTGSPGWSQIVAGVDAGGQRDYLDDEPIHCGSTLELQSLEVRADDVGEYTVKLLTGTLVRYERNAGKIVLYVYIGGHEFASSLTPWMRFRWPRRPTG